MRLTVLIKFALLLAFSTLLLTSSAQGAIASVAKTARTLQSTFLKIASKPSTSRSRKSAPPSPVELLFVIDRSGSIGSRNFGLALRFVRELTRFFSVSPSTTRVAAISYSTTVRTEFPFNANVNRECVNNAIHRIRYTGGLTATGPSLQRAITLFQSARPSAKKAIFLLTDGRSNRGVKPSIPAAQLKNSGVEIFVLGIGYSVNVHELKSIAFSNDDVYRVRNFADLQRLINALNKKPRDACVGYGIRYDECSRRCSCVYGKLVNCCRVRKDFPSMSREEKERYISAYLTITTQQPYKARYNQLVGIHRTFFQTPIHQQREFLPWHRWYLLQLENLLREVDCRVTIPYWDWSLWSHDPWSANAIWSSVGNQGFGGNGNPAQGRCVTTGPFRTPVWQTARGQCLRRDFNGNVPDAAQVQFCLNLVPFSDFEIFLRVNLHNLVHVLIGGFFGQMSGLDSANAPEFNLHHCFVDKIWGDWQAKSSANLNAFFPSINTRMTATQYYPRDFVHLTRQPGCVRTCYENPIANSGRAVRAFLRGLTTSQLAQLKRTSFSTVTKRMNDMFKTSPKDRTRAKALEGWARKGIASSVSLTTTLERIRGFKMSIINRPTLAIRPLRTSSGNLTVVKAFSEFKDEDEEEPQNVGDYPQDSLEAGEENFEENKAADITQDEPDLEDYTEQSQSKQEVSDENLTAVEGKETGHYSFEDSFHGDDVEDAYVEDYQEED